MKILHFIAIGTIISSVLTGILMLINYTSAVMSSDILIGFPTIGGEGEGKSGFGIWVIYNLNEIRFDSFTLVIDFLIVMAMVMVLLLLYKAVNELARVTAHHNNKTIL